MPAEGVPPGGKLPSKQAMEALLRKFGAEGGAALSTDRRFLYGKQLNRIFSDSLTQGDTEQGLQAAGQYFNPTTYSVSQTVDQQIIDEAGGDQPRFTEWDIPTSSTNYQKPRTVAAGYTPNDVDPNKGVMTVVFRDGTFYNYYEVSPTEWEAFHASYSKGRPWLNRKNKRQASDGLFIAKPRGDAGDMVDVDPMIREQLYRVARAWQVKTTPSSGRTQQHLYESGGELKLTGKGTPTFPVPNRMGRNPASKMGSPRSSMGKNPATANRAPRRRAS